MHTLLQRVRSGPAAPITFYLLCLASLNRVQLRRNERAPLSMPMLIGQQTYVRSVHATRLKWRWTFTDLSVEYIQEIGVEIH